MLENVYEGLNAQKYIWRLKCSKMYIKAWMLKNVYEGLNARPKVYLSKEYFCQMYPTCVSSKLCEFIMTYISLKFLGWQRQFRWCWNTPPLPTQGFPTLEAASPACLWGKDSIGIKKVKSFKWVGVGQKYLLGSML